jgi:hypothetical protein
MAKRKYAQRGGKTHGKYRVSLNTTETVEFLVATGQVETTSFFEPRMSQLEAWAIETMRYVSKLSLSGVPAELCGNMNGTHVFLMFAEDGENDIQMPPKRMSYADLNEFS